MTQSYTPTSPSRDDSIPNVGKWLIVLGIVLLIIASV